MNEDVTRSQVSKSSKDKVVNDEQLVDELDRIRREVANAKKQVRKHPLQLADSISSTDQLDSARRVMELLASMRPSVCADADVDAGQTILDVDGETKSEEVNAKPISVRDLDMPQAIGRFEIHELLGQGGFGMVFRAHDLRLERDVALKVPTANSLLSSESRQRFERECRAVASLSHPNIVPVFEVGNDGPVNYLASELVEGTDLAKWVRENGVPEAMDTALAMVKIAEAVQHAHTRGVIHRDLKPANILLALKNESGSARFDSNSIRITDFGLAKFCDEDASLTQTGSVLGTPAFAAPEQLRGGIEQHAAELADVYSLGAVLYFQLTGEAPFAADSILALIQKVHSEEPPHPQNLNPAIPRDLAAICLKAMDKDLVRRYASAWEFRSDLERFLRDEPTVARPMTVVGKVAKWCRRNPVVSGLLTLVAMVLVCGFSTTYYQWQVAQGNLSEVTRQKMRSDKLLRKAEDSIDAMLYSTADAMKDLPSMTEVRQKMLEDALAIQVSILEEEQDSESVQLETVEAHNRVARIQQELGKFAEAKETLSSAIELLENISPATPSLRFDTAILLHWRMRLETQLGNFETAEISSAHILDLFDEVEDSDLEEMEEMGLQVARMEALRVQGELAERKDRLDEAEALFAKAIAIGSDVFNEDQPEGHLSKIKRELVAAWNSLAIVQRASGKLEAAHGSYVASLEINSQLMKEEAANRVLREMYSTTAHNFANLLYQLKKYDEAGKQYRESFTILNDLSIKFPSVYRYQRRLPSTLSGLSLIQKKSGDLEGARSTTQKSIRLLERSKDGFGPKEGLLSSLALARRALASIDSELKDYDTADMSFASAELATRDLVESWPTNPKYRYELGLTIGNEACSLVSRKEFELASMRLFDAILEARKSVELGSGRIQYRNSLSFLHRKRIESLIGCERFEEASVLLDSIAKPDSSGEELLKLAAAASNGIEHHLIDGEFEPSILPEIQLIKDRIFSLLDAALEKGLAVECIAIPQFKAIADDERFELLSVERK